MNVVKRTHTFIKVREKNNRMYKLKAMAAGRKKERHAFQVSHRGQTDSEKASVLGQAC